MHAPIWPPSRHSADPMTSLTNERSRRRSFPEAEGEVVGTAVPGRAAVAELVAVAERVSDGSTAVVQTAGATVA